jgi:hypothetical protein
VYPLNFLIASLSIFTPDVVGYLGSKLRFVYNQGRDSRLKS